MLRSSATEAPRKPLPQLPPYINSRESTETDSPEDLDTESSGLDRSSNGNGQSTPTWKRAEQIRSSSVEPTTQRRSLHSSHRKQNDKPYKLSNPSTEEMEEIRTMLGQHPAFSSRYKFSVKKVNHPVLEAQFNSKIDSLHLADSEALIGSWQSCPEQELRQSVNDSVNRLKKQTQHVNVFTLRVIHGTKSRFKDAVLTSGLYARAKTDAGYFGQGIYFTTYPEYSVMYAGRGGGVLIVCDVAFRILFPVGTEDLMGKPIKPGFDGHAVHVVPKTDNPSEMMYVSRSPWQKAVFDEYVILDSSQTCPRFVVDYTPNEEMLSVINVKMTRKDLKQIITAYIEKRPLSDLFVVLTRKLEEIEEGPLDKVLNPDEVDLLVLLKRTFEETEDAILKNLEERVVDSLKDDDSKDLAFNALPTSYIKEQELSESNDKNLSKGDQHLKQGKWKQAIVEYKKTLEKAPLSFRANVGCGKAFANLEDWNQAILHFHQAVNIKKNDVEARAIFCSALLNRARASTKTKDFGPAAKDLLEVINVDSSNIEALGLLAQVYFTKDCFKPAYRTANRALAINQHYAPALIIRGAIYATWGPNYYPKAEEDFNRSLVMQPNLSIFTLIHRARLFIKMGRFDDAEKDCNALLGKDQDNIHGLAIRATLSVKRNDLKQAEAHLKKYEKKLEDHFVFFSLMGELWMLKGDLSKALTFLDKGISKVQSLIQQEQEQKMKILTYKDRADYYELLLLRAEVYSRKNNVPSTVSDYQLALSLFPNNPQAYTNLGNCYKAWGDNAKARENYAKARELASVDQ